MTPTPFMLINTAAAVLKVSIETPRAAIHADKYNGSLIRTALSNSLFQYCCCCIDQREWRGRHI